MGDLSENSEYKFALEERDLLRARLAQMNNDLSRARELHFHDVPKDHVGIGSHVTAREIATGETRSMTFLGPFDTDVERSVYNYLAPFSQKFMGARLGDHVKVTLDGRDAELEVVAIENGLRALNG
ncbi:MAG: GreA/GreB family elongation factor [Phycisphaerae bacterium]